VQHKWWEFDATYYVILVLERLGLATDVIQPRHVRKAATTTS
jgi:stearoyl-CoA desaturase (delta-9 desaturase)